MQEKIIPPETPHVLFTLFTLSAGSRWWGFKQMGLVEQHFRAQKDLRFGELLGTGKGRGFSAKPDFSRYAIFSCWQTEEAAREFLQNSPLYQSVRGRSREMYTLHMLPVMAKGAWKGSNPFNPPVQKSESYPGPVVALTRANIRWQRLLRFWKHVPGVSAETSYAKGLLAQTGVGERPLIQQGTISIWESEDCLTEFAYQMRQHREVIQKTRAENWYSEELFARFIPVEAEGSWGGDDPLAAFDLEKAASQL